MKANVFGASFPMRWGVSTSPRISDGISTRMETRIPSGALHHPSAWLRKRVGPMPWLLPMFGYFLMGACVFITREVVLNITAECLISCQAQEEYIPESFQGCPFVPFRKPPYQEQSNSRLNPRCPLAVVNHSVSKRSGVASDSRVRC